MLSAPTGRERRRPARFLNNALDELKADDAAGAHILDNVPDDDDVESIRAILDDDDVAEDDEFDEADHSNEEEEENDAVEADSVSFKRAQRGTARHAIISCFDKQPQSSAPPAMLPTLSTSWFKRKRSATNSTPSSKSARTAVATTPQSQQTSSESTTPAMSTSAAPKWTQGVVANAGGFTFSEDWSKFYCACSPGLARATGGGSSNAMKHRQSKQCQWSTSQTTLFEKRERKLTSKTFESLLVDAIIDCKLPFSIVESDSFRSLVLAGSGREHLSVSSRRTLLRRIDDAYLETMEHLKQSLAKASSRISITFDLWTDRRTRGYIAITGHYFDEHDILRAPLLAIAHMPKDQEVIRCVSLLL